MNHYICIHGHFYQPPRENPWLEHLERQDSAYPYHDWNERVTAECYAPNSRSRILDNAGKIKDLVNNYAWISFNFGPTVLSWMELKQPEVYAAIQQADRESQEHFSGHGSALAQAYNPMILPLANTRDQLTQVRWGVADFKHRFGRMPEGMWLAETAADTASLEALADSGIKFTVLAPRQARHMRKIGDQQWIDVSGGRVDPTQPYLCKLPSGKSIVLFFYDGPISQALAFEKLLENGETFASRLRGAFREDRNHPQIVHIATDGETYGHHRRHAEMALSYAIRRLVADSGVRLTNYGEYLELHPPEWEAQIFENSSWSCVHGVERWRADCGCNSGMNPGWKQDWRAPLREALDGLRDRSVEIFEKAGGELFRDPWATRDRYIQVVLDRDHSAVTRFLSAQGAGRLTPAQKVRALELLEMQRNAMLMYTSCGWFFDEISGLETTQILQYAARVAQLAHRISGSDPEPAFLERLEKAPSNVAEHGNGAALYKKWIRPQVVDLTKVAAHYAVSSLFESYPDRANVYAYRATREANDTQSWGKRTLAMGRVKVESRITREGATFSYAVLHLGDHNISGGVRVFKNAENYESARSELSQLFQRDNVPDMIRAVDRLYGGRTYSLQFLFRDDQRLIVDQLLETAVTHAYSLYSSFYREYGPMGRYLSTLAIPLPHEFRVAIDLTLQGELNAALSNEDLDPALVAYLVEQIQSSDIQLDTVRLEFALREMIENLARKWRDHPGDMAALHRMEKAIDVMDLLPFRVNLWAAQNLAYDVVKLTANESISARWRLASSKLALRLSVAPA